MPSDEWQFREQGEQVCPPKHDSEEANMPCPRPTTSIRCGVYDGQQGEEYGHDVQHHLQTD